MDLSPANIARLEHVLRTLDFTQGADAEIRADGYLWICPKPGRKWKRSAKMRGQERAAAVVWLAQYRQHVASPGFPEELEKFLAPGHISFIDNHL